MIEGMTTIQWCSRMQFDASNWTHQVEDDDKAKPSAGIEEDGSGMTFLWA